MALTKIRHKRLIERRVDKGIEALEKAGRTGWYRNIRIGSLNMGDASICMLGQTFQKAINGTYENGYEAGLVKLGLGDNPDDPKTNEKAIQHGFQTPDNYRYDYDELGAVWIEKIRERRRAKNR